MDERQCERKMNKSNEYEREKQEQNRQNRGFEYNVHLCVALAKPGHMRYTLCTNVNINLTVIQNVEELKKISEDHSQMKPSTRHRHRRETTRLHFGK